MAKEKLDLEAKDLVHKQKDHFTEEEIKGPLYVAQCNIKEERIQIFHNEEQIW